MRRIAAAVATTVLVTVSTVGPVAASPAQDPVYEISCGTIGDPICPVIDQLKTLLAPLEPVLAGSQPLLGELGNGLTTLTQLLEMAPGIPAAQLAEASGQVLDQLGTVTQPVLTLLSSLGLPADLLGRTLGQLDALIRHGIETFTQQLPGTAGIPLVPAPAPAPESAPESAPSSSAGPAASSSPSPAAPSATATASSPSSGTTFRNRVAELRASRDATPRTRSVTFKGVPANSSTLQLSPLGLPRIGSSAAAAPTAVEAAAERVAEDLVLPAAQAAAAPRSGSDGRIGAVAFAIGALLLAGGLLIDQTRKARQPIEV